MIFLAFIYIRVSTINQAREGNSMEAQTYSLKQGSAVKIFNNVFSDKPKHHHQIDKLQTIESHRGRLQAHYH